MNELHEKRCEACRVGAPLVAQAEIDEFMPQLPGWEIIETEGIRKLSRTYKLKDFKEAMSFSNRVGAIAEEEGHHPTIVTEWGKVTVTWWSKKIKGLHVNDFVMAAKTDKLLTLIKGPV